jgi:hypothetical protein
VAVAATLAQFKKQIDQLSAKVAQLQAQEKASGKTQKKGSGKK